MVYRKNLPINASVATPIDGVRLNAPSAARNTPHILSLLGTYGPSTGSSLELASGTGQHIVELAQHLPDLTWHPSDVDEGRLASIAAYVTDANLPNLHAPIPLDATASGWGAQQDGQALILLVNLLHLISDTEARTLISEAARALNTDGRLIIYGPFMRNGALTSEGDTRFHASLRAQDPEIGYKSDHQVMDWGVRAGLTQVDVVDMPANNLAIIWQR